MADEEDRLLLRGNGRDEDEEEELPEFERFVAAVVDFANAEDWSEARRVLEEHPELLTPDADLALEYLIEMTQTQGQREAARILSLHRDLLRLAREVGVEETFARLEEHERLQTALKHIFEVIAHNTIAVLTVAPERRPEWLAQVQQIAEQAKQAGDEEMVALLGAVARLLEGEEATAIPMQAGGPYAACWREIVEWMAGGGVEAPPPPMDMFHAIAHNTIAVLEGLPGPRAAWLEHVRQVRRQAEDLGDRSLAALMEAITRLLEGDPPATINPPLEGPYLACWREIVEEALADREG